MPKLVTVMLPHVPQGFIKTFDSVRPPFLKDYATTQLGPGVFDLELTFEMPPIPPNKKEADFIIDVKATMYMALIVYYEAFPISIAQVLSHLVKADAEWKRRAEVAAGKPDKPDYLATWLIHDLVIMGGDLLGIDHRPCWEAGKCLHTEG